MTEWISVTHTLPQPREHVIGYCRTKLNPEWHVEPLLYEDKDTWAYLFAYNEGYGYAIEVKKWMPLPPNPPKEGSE